MRNAGILNLLEKAEEEHDSRAALAAAEVAMDGMEELEKRLQSLRMKKEVSMNQKIQVVVDNHDKGIEEAKKTHENKVQQYLEAKENELKSEMQMFANKKSEEEKKIQDQFTEHSIEEAEILAKMKVIKGMINVMVSADVPKVPECPACLEEMLPPIKIFQCASGHPLCEACR